MALFFVTLSMDLVVEADNTQEAETLALESAADEMDNALDPFVVEGCRRVTRPEHLPVEWVDSRPYRQDGAADQTCREILDGEGT
jgi:hypothetical protein